MRCVLVWFGLLCLLPNCTQQHLPAGTDRVVIVTLSPYQTFVSHLLGKDVHILTLVPPGYNPHLFELRPADLKTLCQGSLWFGIGDPIEKHANLCNSTLKYINLNQAIGVSASDDLHTWLSPSLMIREVTQMAEVLEKAFPEQAASIEKNLLVLTSRLETLLQTLRDTLASCRGKAIIVSHPSLTYFCREFDLIQLSIESEGKSAAPKDLARLLHTAKQEHAFCALTQEGVDNRGTLLLAQELAIPVYSFDPMSADYFQNLKTLADELAHALTAI